MMSVLVAITANQIRQENRNTWDNLSLPQRAETGPLQLGNDWTGYFFRGDEALWLASDLRNIADALDRGDKAVTPVTPDWMRRLATKLEACKQ